MKNPAPVALGVAPNGGRRTHADHPAIPLSPGDLANAAAACLEAGAAMIHLHVRDRDGGHLLDAEAFAAAISAVRGAVGDRMVIQMTTESLGLYAPPEQMAVVKAVRPEAISLALREFAPAPADEPALADFLAWLKRESILPQFILYSPEELVRLDEMRQRGLIPWEDPAALFVLGRYTVGQTSTPADLLPFLAPGMPRPEHWMACAFGQFETACACAAALLGGHARIGFENNLCLPDGTTARDNAALVAATRAAIAACGLRCATGHSLRADWARLAG